ncbi:hypothetical protein PTT44_07395 [Acinetobacter sp. Gutcm_16]|uniref:hypothetical protein n=1 Tax=unclassified Acinetobacter TaxID=196816 RepID=UPI0002CDC2F6|nr:MULTISPECIES: hypothetical protein [unclassified Acinetobacter]ENU86598.1 hypothetical protein F973_00805 [Acinetobacter sp. CIP 102129]MDD0802395.1 hypothetical protein [Acinetobacter sp. Gutcm_16]
MIDYSIFYTRPIEYTKISENLPNFDIFISAFNDSERVKTLFESITSTKKFWLVHPEYHFSNEEIPSAEVNEVIIPSDITDISQVNELLSRIGDLSDKNICIDITGFMRHVLIFLVASLKYNGVDKFTAIYSEPKFYSDGDNTNFSTTTSSIVKSISGISATSNSEFKDHLIINIGYDHKMLSQIASYKDGATYHPVFSFPSLSADMYQQSSMRAALSGSITQNSDWITKRKFSPANNPFATAQVISDLVKELDLNFNGKNNIYLAPLSTKAQTLGFAIYWVLEGRDRGITILLPECLSYSRETSQGLKRLWSYEVELKV